MSNSPSSGPPSLVKQISSNYSTPKGSNLNLNLGKVSTTSSNGNINNTTETAVFSVPTEASPSTAQIRQAFKAMEAKSSPISQSPKSPRVGSVNSLTGSNQNLNMAVDGSRRRSSAQSNDLSSSYSPSPVSKSCDKCGKIVYPMESMTVEGKLIHKSVQPKRNILIVY